MMGLWFPVVAWMEKVFECEVIIAVSAEKSALFVLEVDDFMNGSGGMWWM
jgi:hypothetical protein